MRRHFTGFAFAMAALFMMPAAEVAAQGWQLLGQATIAAGPERDVIQVGPQDTRFSSIRLEVKRNDVEIVDLKIVYGNGETEDIRVRQSFKAGSQSRAIPLARADRNIKQIIVTYRARGPVAIQFFGEAGAPIVAPGKWVEFGCKRINFVVDKDVIPVGRKEGRFDAIRLRVKGSRLEVLDLRVIYGNGDPDSIPVRAVIQDGGETKPLSLKNRERSIRQIELVYRSAPTFKGKATICADGRS